MKSTLILIAALIAAVRPFICPEEATSCLCNFTGEEWHVTCMVSLERDLVLTWDPFNYRITIFCDGYPVSNLSELFNAFEVASKIKAVALQDCPLPAKPFKNYLENVNVSELYITAPVDRPVASVNIDLFKGLPNLTKLGFGRIGVMNLPKDLLYNSQKLEYIDLSRNNLDTIPAGFFNYTPNVTIINMASNHLRILKKPLGNLQHLEKLYLHNNELVNISRPVFQSLANLKFLDLQGNYLEELAEDVFADLINLQELRLFSNRLTRLPSKLLGNNHKLEYLDLRDNPNMQLTDHLVANHTHLKYMNFAGCNLSALPPFFLEKLTNVTDIDLSSNRLENLQENLFQDVVNLVNLSLNNNRIKELPPKIFINQRFLERLSISNNLLTSIHNKTFEFSDALTSLDISRNQIVHLQNPFKGQTRMNLVTLKINNNALAFINRDAFFPCIGLQFLDLSVNNLETIDFQLPQKLVKLNVSHNKLLEMPLTFQQWLQNLDSIDLSYNRIQMISAANLQFYADQAEINLKYNNISTIDLSLEQFMTTSDPPDYKPVARLGYNPINCDCHIRYLLTHMIYQLQDRSVVFTLDVEHLTCSSPSKLRGREITSLLHSDLYCIVQRDCPEFCECFLWTKDMITEVRCSSSGLTEIPFLAPANTTLLNITNNELTSLKNVENPSWANISVLILSNNKINDLDAYLLPASLTALHLESNNLEKLSVETLESVSKRENLKLWLGNNPWLCDCENVLERWLESTANVMDVYRMECANLPNITVAQYECPDSTPVGTDLLIGLVFIALLLTLLISFAGIAYYKYLHEIRVWLYSRGWCMCLVSEKDVDADKQFDAFISFSQEDIDWVAGVLLPGLEKQEPYYNVCVHQRDWLVGEWIPDQIVRSVEVSCRTIVVLSDNFIKSVWGRLEFKTAHHQALQDRMNRVIVIVLGEVPSKDEMDPDMRMYVGLNTYLKWEDPWFWKKLRYAMPHKPVGVRNLESDKKGNVVGGKGKALVRPSGSAVRNVKKSSGKKLMVTTI